MRSSRCVTSDRPQGQAAPSPPPAGVKETGGGPALPCEPLRRGLPGLWAGLLLCIGLLATPAPFAVLDKADAGRVVGHIFVREAWLSLALGVLLLVLERSRARRAAESGRGSQFSTEMVLALGAIFCTVVGYFGLQPLLAAARAGQGALSFGQLHAVSFGLFGLKAALVMVLAWRAVKPPATSS